MRQISIFKIITPIHRYWKSFISQCYCVLCCVCGGEVGWWITMMPYDFEKELILWAKIFSITNKLQWKTNLFWYIWCFSKKIQKALQEVWLSIHFLDWKLIFFIICCFINGIWTPCLIYVKKYIHKHIIHIIHIFY